MFTLQGTTPDYMGECLPGMVKTAIDKEDRSAVVEFGNVPFGAAVVQGSVDKTVRLPDAADSLGFGASGLRFRGVVRRTLNIPNEDTALVAPEGDGQTAYYKAAGCMLDVITHGEVKVCIDGDVNHGDPVFFRHTVSANGAVLGVFRADDDGGTCQEVPHAQFTQTASAGDNAWLELSTPRY